MNSETDETFAKQRNVGNARMAEDRAPTHTVPQPESIVDRDVFESVYRAWAPQMYRFCYQRLQSVENAEDATSQIFHQAFRGRAGFHGGSVPAWLFRIAERVITDHYRANRPTTPLVWADAIVDHSPGPEIETIRRDEAMRLERAIAELPEMRRRVIELRRAGLSSPDIARILDRSPEWVRTNQRRAILQLQSALQIAPNQGDPSHD